MTFDKTNKAPTLHHAATWERRRPQGLNVQFMNESGDLDEYSFADHKRASDFVAKLSRLGRAFAISA